MRASRWAIRWHPFSCPRRRNNIRFNAYISSRFRIYPRFEYIPFANRLWIVARSIRLQASPAFFDTSSRNERRKSFICDVGELAFFADLNVQTMQTYGRDLYESIGETKVAEINRGFSPTREETDLSWSRSIGSIRGWRDISFASEKKKKEFSSTMNERTQQYSPRDSSIKGIGKERGYYVHA